LGLCVLILEPSKKFMIIGIKTLGCKSNRYESDQIFDELILKGHKVFEIDEMASSFVNKTKSPLDLIILNTCTVTHLADKKSKQAILSFKKAFPTSKIFVFGCAVNVSSIIASEFNEIDYFAKSREEIIEKIYEQESCATDIPAPRHCEQENCTSNIDSCDFSSNFIEPESSNAKSPFNQRTRTLIKIQDGCENFCTYCIIAKARGKERSFDSKKIISEIVQKEKLGFKEAIITGINIGKWKERGLDFSDLIEKILNSTKKIRIRISSIEPVLFSDKFFELFKNERLCPQIHLSLQSGSEKILKLMNRHYNKNDFFEICERLKKSNEDFAITTDIIVGFPGENEEDFLETMEFAKKIGFLKIHVFPYSKRNKTPASSFPNQVLPEIKKERAKKLRKLSDEMGQDFMKRFIGREMKVLVEGFRGKFRKGFTENFLPVKFIGNEELMNKFIVLQITRFDEKEKILIGEFLREE
jgi:threonylcarbamoyladenosine tRNA methylthiotransferase MtaB